MKETVNQGRVLKTSSMRNREEQQTHRGTRWSVRKWCEGQTQKQMKTKGREMSFQTSPWERSLNPCDPVQHFSSPDICVSRRKDLLMICGTSQLPWSWLGLLPLVTSWDLLLQGVSIIISIKRSSLWLSFLPPVLPHRWLPALNPQSQWCLSQQQNTSGFGGSSVPYWTIITYQVC